MALITKINEFLKKTWKLLVGVSALSTIIVLILDPKFRVLVASFFAALWAFLSIDLPDVLMLVITIIAVFICFKIKRKGPARPRRIRVIYPRETISVLEWIAGRKNKRLEKEVIFKTFATVYPDFCVIEINILLNDLSTKHLVDPWSPSDPYNDTEYFDITTAGLQYLHKHEIYRPKQAGRVD